MKNIKKPIFRDESLQEKFEKDGYVIIPFLDVNQVNSLRKLYDREANIDLESEFNDTSRFLDLEKNNEISEAIKIEFEKSGASYFINHIIPGGTFFVKKSGAKEEIPMHQDWNIVDEEQYISSQIWCPLQDVTKDNGAMILIPGSHEYFKVHRSGSIHPIRFASSAFIKGKVGHALKTIDMKAGEALIYQHSMYHGSYPNPSQGHRLIATCSLLSEEASLLYLHKPSESSDIVQVIDGTGDFYLDYINDLANGRLPKEARVIKTIDKASPYPEIKEILAKIKTVSPVPKRSLLKRIFNV